MQQSFGIVEKFVGCRGVQSQRARRELRRHGGFGHGRIGWNEADFVDVNVRIALQRRFQLFGKLHGLGAGAGGKTAHEAREAGLRNLRRKMDAGDTRGGKHPRETFFCLS